MRERIQKLLLAIGAAGLVPVALAVALSVATGSARLMPFDHPAWLVLLVLGGISGLYTLRGSKTTQTDQVTEALRDLAEEQRKRARSRLNLSHATHDDPMAVMAKQNGDEARPISEIVDEFREKLVDDRMPRVIMLGPSGAGKTTMAAFLVNRILASADHQQVPVLFRLASWDPDKEFTDWLSDQLAEDHPQLSTGYPRSVLKTLVTDRKVLVLLDGLDEIPAIQRPKALAKIDEWLDDHRDETPFVLTCRTNELPALDDSARVLGTMPRIHLEPVDPDAAMAYLGDQAIWEPLRRRRAAEDPQGPLIALLAQPLMLFLAREVGLAPGRAGRPVIEQLGNRDAHETTEELEELLLAAFITTMYQKSSKHQSDRRRWSPRSARRWLAFLARRLTEHGRHDFGWHGLAELAPGRGWVPPVMLGTVAGVVVAVASRLVGLPVTWWWGLAAGAGFATLLWLLERGALRPPAAHQEELHPFRRAAADGLGIGMFGGLAVGLPGAFFARFLSAGTATLLLGAVLGIVAGLFRRRPDGWPAGTGLVTGIAAGPVAWLVAALTCGFPQGAQVGYADKLPGGAAIGALQAWRSALGFGLADQLWTAVAFSLVVGVLAGVVVELAGGRLGDMVMTRRHGPEHLPSGHVMVPLAAAALGACAGAVAGAVLLGGHGAAGGAAVGAGFAAAYVVVALRHRPTGHTDRSEVLASLLVSLHLRVRLGLAGGIAGGLMGGLLFPEQYRYLGESRLASVFAGGADGLQAGFVLGLLAGLAFGLRTGVPARLSERMRQLRTDADAVQTFAVWATVGACMGALMGVALDAALGVHIRQEADVVVGTYAAAGIVLGLAVAIAIVVERRYNEFGHHSTLHTARHSALAATGLVATAAGVGTWFVANPTFGVIAFVMAGTLVLGSSPWGVFAVTRTRLAASYQLPWRLNRFLRDALDLGVLHQAGSGYQFRHARLREAASGPPPLRKAPARRVFAPLAGAAAAMILGPVVVLGMSRPPPDTTAYHDFRTMVSTITAVDWDGSQPVWDGSSLPMVFSRGYAVETAFVLYGRGRAGVYLPGIAYVTASCTGQYSVNKPSAPYLAIRAGYLEHLDGGDGCTIELAALVQDRTAHIFANGVHIHDLTFERTPGHTLPAPNLVSVDNPRALSLDAMLWSLDDLPRLGG